MLLNNFRFIGRLVKDANYFPATEEKKAYANFSIAVDSGNDKTDYFNLITFGSVADFIGKYTKKGTLLALQGRIDASKEIEVVDGNSTYKKKDISFIVEDVKVLAYPQNKDSKEDE